MFLGEISSIFKETIINVNFKGNSLVINPLTTVRFSETVIFIFKKFKFQTPISAELKQFRPWFEFRW